MRVEYNNCVIPSSLRLKGNSYISTQTCKLKINN